MAIALIGSQLWRAPSPCRLSSVYRSSSTIPPLRVNCSVDPTSTSSAGSTSGDGDGGSKKHVDTRIHWGDSAEGWIGIDCDDETSSQFRSWGRRGRSNSSLLDQASDSHYRYMGLSSDAELEEIKSAYRRLSKLYHPDTTQLPLEIAAQKFMRLKDAYDTLSNEELRNLYDSRLENKIVMNNEGSLYGYPTSSQQGYNSPTQKRPERVDVDTLGGDNMPLSDQALTALGFDLLVFVICVLVIIYVAYFKHAA
ncbi:NAD(P)H-quinone oxidoreductase subunit T, chloroplastic [Physcomitrium patens]|uniref:J domain-containing protein n=1 Tax=Physcomitrium patens TaxID=3218 RepID=A0A2K1J830_PHYPA|nr:NAD(P)H-quinone oxidoreductase subunit T, chloroplastic-like [Physcomitrium patens]XP_024398015.1 NAD(P)H-quinone oxidoreductase subunit T, chloroplastic-like [Physcomitrium patens]XP_024398016.1 NAD(P)H-quinone oxidoreductase subunit T, chloroplastic-like [Physcomitrium patens]PNR37683.1 hypothetical protein PHYPA_020792 [Physcomitrium patens]|eukprot:XP_024398014.1 NAD(P)H-quinone oxidoreductase subunit T, chloroplastic-like [Physcomitrella patens]